MTGKCSGLGGLLVGVHYVCIPQGGSQHYIHLLGGLSPIHSMCWRRAKGLVWGARGPFPPAAAMVGYGCDGCWRRTLDQPTVEIVKIEYGSSFFIPT